jgi:para-nitrobenzyl esterase
MRHATQKLIAYERMRAFMSIAVLSAACRSPERHAGAAPTAAAPTATSQCVRTAAGCVRGVQDGGIEVFRGIPYAAPPVGPLRWKLPQQPAPWRGERDATKFGKSCPQTDNTLGGKLDTDEDCLTLNVWTSHADASAKLPVMLWIHGGSLNQGGSAQPTYNGARLAGQGIVLVSINYRLGPLGFFAHPALSAEDAQHHVSGNLGLHDQVAALEWVKANIAAFGGDPRSVTIFGESAGGESVCALMASPLARGLFTRAIVESAECLAPGTGLRELRESAGKLESAEAQGLRIAHTLGCDGDGAAAAACMRSKTPAELLRAGPPRFGFLAKGEQYTLTLDGYALSEAPAALLVAGKLANVPVIVGTTANEATLFSEKVRIPGPFVYEGMIAKMFPGHARDVLAAYAPRSYPSAKQAYDALVTDLVFTCPARQESRGLRQHQPNVYRYLFSHVSEQLRSKGLGATHSAELPFVFGTVSSPSNVERGLATTMIGYWTQFAKTGDPNHASAPHWPVYDASRDTYLELGDTIAAGNGLRSAGCDVLDAMSHSSEPAAD